MDNIDELVSDIFDLAPSQVDDSHTPEDLPGWDSLNHLRLITAIEQEFDLTFTMDEVQSIDSIGRLKEIVAAKRGV